MEKNIFSSDGRIGRSAFWTRCLIAMLITAACEVILKTILRDDSLFASLKALIDFVFIIFIIIQGVKRMHDVDKSGLYLFIPILNLILALTDGSAWTNKYGVP